MEDNKLIWSGLDLELIKKIEELKLPARWEIVVQSMTINYLYSVRRTIEDAIKDMESKKL